MSLKEYSNRMLESFKVDQNELNFEKIASFRSVLRKSAQFFYRKAIFEAKLSTGHCIEFNYEQNKTISLLKFNSKVRKKT